ncbi:hypothetical protein PE066_09105 [Ramlibacter tataouinensis]|nr:hypothetical protein [Ramlibacter tataouinensis]WBY03671.1 hypothetical protein PE066_09105 [Ramlibacter tataouinensis]
MLLKDGVHGSAVARQFRILHERSEEHPLLALMVEMAGELGEEGGEPPAVVQSRRSGGEPIDVRAKRSEHPIDQHVFVLERVDHLHRRFALVVPPCA